MRKWWWWILGATLVVLALVSLDWHPDRGLAAPLAASTPIIQDQDSLNNFSAGVVMGVKATPGAAGTPGVYEPINSTSGALNTTGGGGSSSGYAPGTIVPVQPNGAPAAQTPVAVAMAGQQVQAATTVVIPAQTPVAYAVGDVVTAATPVALAFSGVCRANGLSGYVVGGQIATDQAANVAAYRLKLYQSAPPVLVADNAANTVLFGNNAIRIGHLDFPAMTTGTGSNTAATAFVFDSRVPFNCAAGSTTINGILETETAFTPASAQQYYISLQVARD